MKSEKQEHLSRREMLKAASGAAIAVALPASGLAAPAQGPTKYGPQNPVDNTNIFPLLTAWIMLTTHGGVTVVARDMVAKHANLHPDNVKTLFDKYEDATFADSFGAVQEAFKEIAQAFSGSRTRYSGGQCPDKAETVAPIASLPCAKA